MRKHILIIEDDADLRSICEVLLADEGFKVTGIDKTNDIIKTVKHYHPDLVLTDYLLWGTNGGKICQLIKQNKDSANIPVVLLTGYPDLANCLGTNDFDDIIEKPFNVDHFLKTINGQLTLI